MDRVSRLRAEAGSTSDVSGGNDTGFQTADDTPAGSTNYLSFSDDDSCTPKKSNNGALGESTPRPAAADAEFTAGLSPIAPTDDHGYSMGGQINARNILSGGVDIFEDYNSNDGDGLVIDDEANVSEDAESGADDRMSRCTEKVICEPIESANLSLSADATLTLKEISESQLVEVGGDGDAREVKAEEVGNNEVILQIDGRDVDALDIGNGLYLYRKGEGEELNALQILQEEGQQPHFKFLKVRQIGDSNLEVYEEHITEVPMTNEELEEEKRKEREEEENRELHKKTPHLPITDFKKALKENPASGKTVTLSAKANTKDDNTVKLEASSDQKSKSSSDRKSDIHSDSKLKPLKNLEGSRKSPILGNFTSMTLHSSANREGAPPTKTMINLPLNSNRNSDTVKKTIEVSTDNSNLKNNEKTTIANLIPPKVDVSTVVTPTKLGDTKDLYKVSGTQEKNNSEIKMDSKKSTSDNEQEKKFNQFENEKKLESSVKSKEEIVNNNASLLSKNDLDIQTDTGIESVEIKKITEKLSLTNKQIDTKKEMQSSKTTNVISKWVLRSDSIEEKTKKDKEKIPVEVKIDTNSFSNKIPFSDISIKNNNKDLEIKQKKMDSLNVNVPQTSTRDNGKEIKDKLYKPASETTALLEKVTKYTLGESSKTTPKSMLTEMKPQKVNIDHKNLNTHIIKETSSGKNDLVRYDKNVKNEKANSFEFVNKYISEALKNVPTRPIAIPPSNIGTNKLGVDNKPKIKPLEKVHVTSVKTTGYDSPLRIDVETATKPVPFGKWTEGDKQEYLNKLKDQKQPSTNSSLSPVKNYQLASAKNDMKRLELKKKADTFERAHLSNVSLPALPEDKGKGTLRDVDMKGLIDKTIEGMIVGCAGKPPTINPPKITSIETTDKYTDSFDDVERRMKELHGMNHPKEKQTLSLPSSVRGAIESLGSISKVSEKSFPKIETDPSHSKTLTKSNIMPKLLPLNCNSSNKIETKPPQEIASVSRVNEDEDSEEEIIDSQPVTGDMQWPTEQTKDNQKVSIAAVQKMVEADKVHSSVRKHQDKTSGITEVEFDKFVRRNSTNQTIPNCTISEVRGTISQASGERVIDSDNKNKQTKFSNQHPLEKPLSLTTSVSKPQQVLGAVRSHIPQAIYPIKPGAKERGDAFTLHHTLQQDSSANLNYNTKIQMAYQSAISAKNQKEPPVKNIDDKSVKIAFVSSNTDVISTAQIIPPVKRNSNADSLICTLSDTASSVVEVKVSDQIPVKTKHQRKQVLTPVETPPIEIIEPLDHADNGAHKKRRKTEQKPQRNETESHKSSSKDIKNISPKKNYLLGRITPVTEEIKKGDAKDKVGETNEVTSNKNATSKFEEPVVEISTPKRGRGRPRKNLIQNSLESPKKNQEPYSKLSESDSQGKNSATPSVDTEYDDSDEEGIIRENWTMSKIDDKIVCPICHKLFRSENIVFKHVKHCSNLLKSPAKRSSSAVSEIRSPKKGRMETFQTEVPGNEEGKSQSEVAQLAISIDESKKGLNVRTPNIIKSDKIQEFIVLDTPSPNEVIVLEDSPLTALDKPFKEKEGTEKSKENKSTEVKKSEPVATQPQVKKVGRPRSTTQHTCEICGKTFRQLSYLIHHKTLHSKEPPKHRPNDNSVRENKPILSCDTCGKDFRKLHHLVEHRESHNINTALQRKTSIDRTEQKKDAEPSTSKVAPKKVDEHPAGFRCEPCDKSFRKLHHLVEHRETHDGVNRLKNSPPQLAQVDKLPTESPTCEICGKSFRKLHHLIEHRETHNESQTEKIERKSSLLARDIIHECSLCYMVFPNEPSLNKHFVNCQKKKKTPTTKTLTSGDSKNEMQSSAPNIEVDQSEPKDAELKSKDTELIPPALPSPSPTSAAVATKRNSKEILQDPDQDIPEKIQKLESEALKTPKNPKPLKGGETVTKITKFGATVTKPAKVGATVTKRSRSSLVPLSENETIEIKFKDTDDEVRYMINPSYRPDSDEEKEIFMNVCVTKRSSLQFDTPSAKAEFKRRRISLQHPPKSQRAGSKKVEKLSKPPNVPADQEPATQKAKSIKNKSSSSTVPSNSLLAEDNEVKYSFPKTAKTQKPQNKSGIPAPKIQTNKVTIEDRTRKADKRKSLTGIAKRKSIGKGATMKPKPHTNKVLPITTMPKKDNKTMVRHVCDCGAPFSSVTLLAQHTSVAHTPPRIRRARVVDRDLPARVKQVKVTKHSGVPVALKLLRDT